MIHADVWFWDLRWCCRVPQQMDDAGKGGSSYEALRSVDGLLGNLWGVYLCVASPSFHRGLR